MGESLRRALAWVTGGSHRACDSLGGPGQALSLLVIEGHREVVNYVIVRSAHGCYIITRPTPLCRLGNRG